MHGCLKRKNLSFCVHVGYFTSQIDKMFHVYAGLICQRFSPKGEKKERRQSERGREMCIDTARSQQHIKAQLQPRPLLQCVEIN